MHQFFLSGVVKLMKKDKFAVPLNKKKDTTKKVITETRQMKKPLLFYFSSFFFFFFWGGGGGGDLSKQFFVLFILLLYFFLKVHFLVALSPKMLWEATFFCPTPKLNILLIHLIHLSLFGRFNCWPFFFYRKLEMFSFFVFSHFQISVQSFCKPLCEY